MHEQRRAVGEEMLKLQVLKFNEDNEEFPVHHETNLSLRLNLFI